ncbi:alanine racemase [Aneurinibacillus sp. Ricciae_BoGa-3]|uniref:alanine racemase n=1 Tax=Aneurinibacillus sp. Ricciae_BoGa-3 TaxID=3022697 RepID=UPI0023426D8E|nr:alanine racemase [Aneurinibacillus sp. Ricciae_BoGa-3]WCK54991.1 alanine racemase [Aneurinibacillus sp. Ricciae_BoGa-3]
MEQFYRDAWAEIDLDAIGENLRIFRRHIGEHVKIMAVVKADGYGHGAYEVASKALEQGAAYLGVALLDEALELRARGIDAPILILSSIPERAIKVAVENNISMTVYRKDSLNSIVQVANSLNRKARLHIKLDTGMGRIGIRDEEELVELYEIVKAAPCIEVDGLFTHFATADEEDTSYFRVQQERFNAFLNRIDQLKWHIPLIHCNNSAAAMFYPQESRHMIRLGISLYGQYPSPYTKSTGMRLSPAFSWKANVTHVKCIKAGESVSYGAVFTAEKETVVATVPVGYADGYNRLLSNRGEVLIKGTRAKVIGRVCMDQFMIDVTEVPGVEPGDEVVLIGKQGDSMISVDEMADWLSTINYEVTCMVSKRIPRVYYENGKQISLSNRILLG